MSLTGDKEPTHRPPAAPGRGRRTLAGFRGRGGQRGRRHRGDQSDLLQSNLVRAISNLSLNSYDSVGSTSRGRYRNDDFETVGFVALQNQAVIFLCIEHMQILL